jgi:hypothetical protein
MGPPSLPACALALPLPILLLAIVTFEDGQLEWIPALLN